MFGLFSKSSKKSRTAKRPAHRRFGMEHLERRELMAFNVFAGTPAPMGPVQTSSQTTSALVASPVAGASTSAAPQAAATSDATVAAAKKATGKFDLDVNIQEGYVVSNESNDLLNLLHFWGREKVTIPTAVKNYGPDAFRGSVTVSIYLSTGKTIDSKAVKLGEKTVNASLANNQEGTVVLNVTMPTTLTPGTKYFLIAKLTTPSTQNTKNDVRNSNRQFEFVGTPTAGSNWFTANEEGNAPYLLVVDETIHNQLMYQPGAGYQVNDPQFFIGMHEASSTVPFLNYKGEPRIGVGINLDSMTPTMAKALATAVRNYNKQAYGQTLSGSDSEIINMLGSQARIGSQVPMISVSDITTLFNKDYAERQQIAVKLLGQTAWSQINPPAKIAVMDMIFDNGTIDKKVIEALKVKDYVRAGFDLLNTGSVGREQRRARAEYQNLLWSVRSSLGSDIGVYE